MEHAHEGGDVVARSDHLLRAPDALRPHGHEPASLTASQSEGVEMPGKTRRATDRARRPPRRYALHPIRAQRGVSRSIRGRSSESVSDAG
jgi:hypothetical protein